MEFIMENTNLLIAIVIFIVCVIIGYFADKKLKLDEIIDKKMKDIDKNGPKKEENTKVEDKKSPVINTQSSIQTNKQSNMNENNQIINNAFNQNINNNNNINGPILTSENIIEEEINKELIKKAFDLRFEGNVKENDCIYKVTEVYDEKILLKIKTEIIVKLK